MAWATYTNANVSLRNPRAFGVCDRCGFVYNHESLKWQYDYTGFKLQNKQFLVCQSCLDTPQQQLRQVILPLDPVPIRNPRPGEFGTMEISSNPGTFNTIAPSQLVVSSSSNPDLGNTNIGNRSPLVTDVSSEPIWTEINVTPNPDPEFGDGGYTVGSSS